MMKSRASALNTSRVFRYLDAVSNPSRKVIVDIGRSFHLLDEASRFDVASVLGTKYGKMASGLLMKILTRDRSALVRHEAAFGLGCVGGSRCLPSLRHALSRDRSFLVRHEAAIALSEIGLEEDITILSSGLADRSREVRVSCRVAIERIRRRSVNGH